MGGRSKSRAIQIIHVLGQDIKNTLSRVQFSRSDSRAFPDRLLPLLGGSHQVEPERKCSALERPNRVNRAAPIKKTASPVCFFDDTEPLVDWAQMETDQFGWGDFEKIGQRLNFLTVDPDDAGITGAAGSTALAFETNASIEKIAGVIAVGWVTIHVAFNLQSIGGDAGCGKIARYPEN